MDRHRLAVIVENDDLKEPAGPVGTDVEVTVALAHYADGVADCVLDVVVGNAVLTGVVRDLLSTDLIIRVQCLFRVSIFDGYVIFAAVGSLPVCVCPCPTG